MPHEVRRWLLILRVPLALLSVFLFFTVYNRFLLDANLQNLRTSLTILDSAPGVAQAEAALLLVDQALTAQMAQEEMDPEAAVVLQYAQGTLSSDQLDRRPEDTQAMLGILGEDQSIGRPASLKAADSAVSSIQATLRQVALLPRQVLGRPLSPEIDTVQLQEAAQMERRGRTPEALALYQQLLAAYPDYARRASLKLRIGRLFQKSGDVNQARHLYQAAADETRDPQELTVARQMLDQLSQLRGRAGRAKTLRVRLNRVAVGPDRQRAAFDLGILLIQNAAFDQAVEAFGESLQTDPEGALALASLFKQAWCLRTSGRMEEALGRFQEVIRRDPKGRWGTSSYFQIAELYKTAGDYKAATQLYAQVSTQTQDSALIALSLATAGSTSLFDLNDPAQAQLLFRDLEQHFPASPFSNIGARILELQRKKGIQARAPAQLPGGAMEKPAAVPEFSLAEGGPVVKWLESFLPLFVDVFSDRLAKYMHAVGEKELTRRFTELEFRDLVVRQIEKRFPDQVSGLQTRIQPDGFVGSGNVRLGILRFSVEARIGITVVNEKPYAIIQEVRVGKLTVPGPLKKMLENRVNALIDRAEYPLKVKQYSLKQGYAVISVELKE